MAVSHVFTPGIGASASTATQSRTYPAAVEAGDVLWAFVWQNSATNTCSGIADSVNGAWTLGFGPVRGNANNSSATLYGFYRVNSGSGTPVVTATWSGAAAGGIIIGAVRGLGGGGALDQAQSELQTGVRADGWELSTTTLAQAVEAGVGCFIASNLGGATNRWTADWESTYAWYERVQRTITSSTAPTALGITGGAVGGGTAASMGLMMFRDATVAVAPSITTQPAAQSVVAGATATFTAAASGSPAPTWQWQRSTNGGSTWSDISGAVAASYTTSATTVTGGGANNADQYRAVATNTAGSVTTNAATLSVSASAVAPSITTNPTTQTVTAGNPVSLTLAATGTAPLTYQWRKGGASISGAVSATYTIGSTVTGDSGSYDCVVTNAQGSATSSAATLTVNAVSAPAPTSSAVPILIGIDPLSGRLIHFP